MPKFQVMAPVEHNQILYVAKDVTAADKAKSMGNGQIIPVDSSGVIELDGAQAKALQNGQILMLSESQGERQETKRTRR